MRATVSIVTEFPDSCTLRGQLRTLRETRGSPVTPPKCSHSLWTVITFCLSFLNVALSLFKKKNIPRDPSLISAREERQMFSLTPRDITLRVVCGGCCKPLTHPFGRPGRSRNL